MNCLQNLPRSSALPLQSFRFNQRKPTSSSSFNSLGTMNYADLNRRITVKAITGSTSSKETSDSSEVKEEKSEIYSTNMTEAMGADIIAIQEYAKTYDDIQHIRAEIRDFDAFDLRMRLPAVISKLYKAINRNGGVTYVHCTAGLGRAPAVALAYMFWVLGYKLNEAHRLLLSKRPCFPKLDAIKSATADILTGLRKELVTFSWKGKNCTSVEISGIDIGWGQRMPLTFDKEQGLWILKRELPEGRYEYKYIVDGEWTCNKYELVTSPNKDGHVNNYVQVDDAPSSVSEALRNRLTSDDFDLTKDELHKIRAFLEACPDYE
ncbi:hypothetical protein CUMW_156830 [Citrus unshiu]|nr:hypothetical protein CUMW_156830 [Citrus unshiu]